MSIDEGYMDLQTRSFPEIKEELLRKLSVKLDLNSQPNFKWRLQKNGQV